MPGCQTSSHCHFIIFFKACSQSLSLCSFPCFKVMKEQWSFASPPPSDYHLVKRRCFYLRQEQCLTDYVISRNYMQICHRYKSAAVRGLTFLFVTSKHSSVACLILLFRPTDKCPPFKRTNPRSSVFTFFSHITAQMFICLQFGLVHEINATLIHLRSCWALFFTNIKKTVYNLLKI